MHRRSLSTGSRLLAQWIGFRYQKFSSVSHETEVLRFLRQVEEPITKLKLSSLGCIKMSKVTGPDSVTIELDFLIPGYAHYDKIKDRCNDALTSLKWLKKVEIKVASPTSSSMSTTKLDSGLKQIKHIIGISSCKGGVGKGTVAVNIACELAKRGLQVGILDADIYGPSLPTLLPVKDLAIRKSSNNSTFITPLQSQALDNLKVLSIGHVNSKAGPPGAGGKGVAVMRGPMVSKVINQLLLATDWGALDYLIIDMPPGTGDIQLTFAQSASLSGAVIITTPHRLALIDAAKGVSMFQQVQIPILSLVENMAYFQCNENGRRYYPFGRGGQKKLRSALIQLHRQQGQEADTAVEYPYHATPLSAEGAGLAISDDERASDEEEEAEGDEVSYLPQPVVLQKPSSTFAKIYSNICDSMIDRLFILQTRATLIPSLSLNADGHSIKLRYFTTQSVQQYTISAISLYGHDPATGLKRLVKDAHSEGISIDRIELKGLYGVGIAWTGKGTEIYPYDVLQQIVQDESNDKTDDN